MLKKLILPSLMLLFLFIAGCSDATNNPVVTKADNTDPVTLKFGLAKGGWLTDEELIQYVVDPVKKKYPYITIERVVMEPDEASLEKLLAQGEHLDLYVTSVNRMGPFITMGLAAGMDDLIKKNKVALNRMDSLSLAMMKRSSGGDFLSALPYNSNFSLLYYNKDIFDRFGVPYPKDGMTWDDAIQVARKVSRTDGGINYLGLTAQDVWRTASQMEVGFVDPKTNKALVNSDPWKTVFETYKKVYSVPGNEYVKSNQAVNAFFKDKRLAMFAGANQFSNLKTTEMNWDIVSYPTYKENPGKGLAAAYHVIGITADSKHRDAAFQVITTLLSDEVQLDISRNGIISILNEDKFKKQFGENLPFLKGKNLQAIFKTVPANRFTPSDFDVKSQSIITDAFGEVVKPGGVDINTALRKAEEEINAIVEQKQ
jgi:multiple sugar transport system substrate-binding protein